jgi:hypothetical protein
MMKSNLNFLVLYFFLLLFNLDLFVEINILFAYVFKQTHLWAVSRLSQHLTICNDVTHLFGC